MACLLLGAVLLGKLALCVTAQEMLAPPGQVRFESTDFRNILRWAAPTNSCSLQYNIQYKIYGDIDWLNVSGCQGIQKHQCDLSSVTSDTREWYYARARASSVLSSSKSAWAMSRRFSPRWDTKISPPAVKLSSSKQGIVVQVKPPRVLVRKTHISVDYNIYVIHANEKEEVYKFAYCSHKLTLTELKPKTHYCIQAQTVIPRHMRSSDRSSAKCITTA
ncbi:interleukin-22 receptor subunit alpha-2 [Girardinichthys multiradiatus]|uniref:interleukin-22 receptor subunit alpha-2 n=1 Tax=Girardinichthys multiradiatus TaxID=208333 RepID=UPI001FAC5BBE|nr:interleukin-22 receptor subunit alpha-2 [Girardinichthys multiradiatus]XP_047208125.1 interleukin-22 receptor subunit alpha-2 [Girardinichthys multiradiatus]